MRLAFAIPWFDRGAWLFAHLPETHQGQLLLAVPEGASRLPPYVRELFWLWRHGYRLADYETVFTWELRCTLAVLVLRSFQRTQTPVVAVGPILKGWTRALLPLIRPLLRQASFVVCFSQHERALYQTLLRLPAERLAFLPTPWTAPADVPAPTDGGYILALGQSNRDYGTLFRALEGLELPVVVVAADTAPFGGVAPPKNVTVKFNTGHDETNALIAAAALHVIPLHPTDFSAGQTVLLRAMAAGKACVVSAVPGVTDYLGDAQTALLVPPHDPKALRAALVRLWESPEERTRLGQAARTTVETHFSFAGFLQRLLELLP